MSLSRCDVCYELTAPACSETLTISPELLATTTYTVFLKDKFGKSHTQELETTGAGAFTLDLTAFDAGMFTAYLGSYELSVSTDSEDSTYEILNINSGLYPCVKLTFVDTE